MTRNRHRPGPEGGRTVATAVGTRSPPDRRTGRNGGPGAGRAPAFAWADHSAAVWELDFLVVVSVGLLAHTRKPLDGTHPVAVQH
ncbi:MAG: hypothetical protein ABI808_13410 [Pseudonocardiales bacterium]